MDQSTPPAAVVDDELAIAIIVNRASDPISGTITLPHTPPASFTGWMQLTQLLTRALDAPR
jgi:hypothetical protein